MQDYTGFDIGGLVAMRDRMAGKKRPRVDLPQSSVSLIIDHSISVDSSSKINDY